MIYYLFEYNSTTFFSLAKTVQAESRSIINYDSSLGSNPDISQKYKMGDKGNEVANTL